MAITALLSQQGGGFENGGTPASVLPLSDGIANDTTNRTGAIGVSTDFARADHVHPLQRITTLPALPTVTIGGAQTLNSSQGGILYSTEETLTYWQLTAVTPTSTARWKTINFPNIAGYNLTKRVYNGVYVPGRASQNYGGENFLWSGVTFYYAPSATFNNQITYFNFLLEYTLT